MPVDEDRRNTAGERRKRIVSLFRAEFDLARSDSALARFSALMTGVRQRPLIVSADIDGLVSAMMLSQATGWKVTALIVESKTVLLHPTWRDIPSLLADPAGVFGVDVFSSRFDNASNHPVLWGTKSPGGDAAAGRRVAEHDRELRARGGPGRSLFLNASFLAGIEGARDASDRALGLPYKYPLGTAQLLLASLEAVGRSPRMFDREYLPWLVANCDGGLKSIGKFPWNVPLWWSALAAAVGPGSLSEQLYRLAEGQRPNEFADIVNRVRLERSEVAVALDDEWNIRRPSDLGGLETICGWIDELSGWGDPFEGGLGSLATWRAIEPSRKVVEVSKIRGDPPTASTLDANLNGALEAIYCSISKFEKHEMGWMLET
jgi:hypothetical protein